MKKTVTMIIMVVLGLAFVAIAYIYFTTPANHLPSFFPGFDRSLHTVHTKHAIGATILALASFILAWFQSGKKTSSK